MLNGWEGSGLISLEPGGWVSDEGALTICGVGISDRGAPPVMTGWLIDEGAIPICGGGISDGVTSPVLR